MKNKTDLFYYENPCSIECIEAMEIAFGMEEVLNFCLCTAFGYLWQYRNGNGIEDLKIAQKYLNKAEDIIESIDDPNKYILKLKALKEIVKHHKIIIGGKI